MNTSCMSCVYNTCGFAVLEQDMQMFVCNGLNPNHDGSSTERDEPNEFSVLRNKFHSRERKQPTFKQPTFFLSVNSCKHGRRRIDEVRR